MATQHRDTEYGIGIIGYGGFGRFLHRAWADMPGVTVCAVSDAHQRLDLANTAFYSRWQDLIADAEIDIVSIATPPHLHVEMACAAMEAGKHVLIEKPLATTLDAAHRIVAMRDRTGCQAAVDYVLRFNPIVETLQAWSRNRWFGVLRRVVVENYAQDDALPPDHWFWDREQSGGILVEHAVHFIDLANACTEAKPLQTNGSSVWRTPRQEDRMMLTTIYDDGLVASQYHEFARPRFFERTTIRFVFDLADVETEGWIPLNGRVRALTDEHTRESLRHLPGFQVTDTNSIDGAAEIRVGGRLYHANTDIEGTFALEASKDAVYRASVQAAMADLIRAIEDPEYQPTASLEAGITSLDIALQATRMAHEAFAER